VPVSLPDDRFSCSIVKEPLGVVALITPWNYPLLMATWKVAPSLAAGCCAVLKPSENAPLTCQVLADIAAAAGVPPGVFSVLTGLGADAGAPLAAHPGVDKVAFTGSLATGRRIMAACAERVCPVTMELGGKSPILVFDDALGDAAALQRATEWVMFGIFWTNGQICSATSRLLVQRGAAPRLLASLKTHAEAVQVGDPMAPGCRMGPLVSAAQYARVTGMVAAAVAAGATLLTGGGRPAALPTGYYLEPTVLVGVTPEMEIWKEEVFGPVLCVLEFDSEEEAVALANASQYGLGAAVLSSCAARRARLAAELEAGIVWLNCSQPCFPHAPWGGCKRSGFGRDIGPEGLTNYQNVKQVTTWLPEAQFDWYPSFASQA